MRTIANWMPFSDFQKSLMVSFFIIIGCMNGFVSASPHDSPPLKTAHLSIPFLANQGQLADNSVLYYAKTFAGTVMVRQHGDIFFQSMISGHQFTEQFDHANEFNLCPGLPSTSMVTMFYPHTIEKQKTRMKVFDYILFSDIYPNISMTLKAYGKTVEKIFTIAPGGNPDQISIAIKDVQNIEINDSGEIIIHPHGIRYSSPKAWQMINSQKVLVDVNFRINDNQKSYGFVLGDYDQHYPLMIDPYIAGTFFGGEDRDEISDLVISPSGAIYVAGTTWSASIPVSAANTGLTQTFDPTNHVHDIFIAKFNSNLTELLSATFIGGSEFDTARAIALDPTGNVFVTGQTTSADFPIPIAASYRRTHSGEGDGFVVRMNSDLSTMLSATYFGGSQSDMPEEMAINNYSNNKDIYITGYTGSNDFQKTEGSALNGQTDAFIICLNNNLSLLKAARYLGGKNIDKGLTIKVITNNSIVVGGQTYSNDFPLYEEIQGYDQSSNGSMDAFYVNLTINSFCQEAHIWEVTEVIKSQLLR